MDYFPNERAVPRRIGRTKGGLNSKLHAVCDGNGRPFIMCLIEVNMSDHVGAKLLYPALPDEASCLIGDKGYDSDEFRAALKAKGISPCIPHRKGRNFPAGLLRALASSGWSPITIITAITRACKT